MAEAYKKLYQGQPGTSAATVYTTPGATSTVVKHVRAVNTSTTVSATIGLYQDGTAATNRTLPDVVLGPGEWMEWDGLMLAPAASTIAAVASVATTITLTIYGIELT
jgi:hypothetical protein